MTTHETRRPLVAQIRVRGPCAGAGAVLCWCWQGWQGVSNSTAIYVIALYIFPPHSLYIYLERIELLSNYIFTPATPSNQTRSGRGSSSIPTFPASVSDETSGFNLAPRTASTLPPSYLGWKDFNFSPELAYSSVKNFARPSLKVSSLVQLV